ncbi:hypothetical protein HMPREF0454_04212 [Hafnia alvei ATCC 51873]|uniref:Uncharacterized protein n=1 Tax=Hafnia alvei ATCC 51873 TaxID=1002364 RepID=G9YC79_HAFAL|nr:hypothetical protein HMPREF0454_04212 [Hafnia alvei ATCC 51873]
MKVSCEFSICILRRLLIGVFSIIEFRIKLCEMNNVAVAKLHFLGLKSKLSEFHGIKVCFYLNS